MFLVKTVNAFTVFSHDLDFNSIDLNLSESHCKLFKKIVWNDSTSVDWYHQEVSKFYITNLLIANTILYL